MDYEQWKIKGYGHWSVYLHTNQFFLGRLYIWHNEDLLDLMDASAEERDELFFIGREVKAALKKLFKPDLFNWASLGNEAAHCHLHVVPRYKKPRIHLDIRFHDTNWGKNWAPYDTQFRITDKALTTIRQQIEDQLGK